jgi:hypothetical protein
MFLVSQFDNDINCNYTMSAANPKKLKVLEKFGGRAMKLLKERETYE